MKPIAKNPNPMMNMLNPANVTLRLPVADGIADMKLAKRSARLMRVKPRGMRKTRLRSIGRVKLMDFEGVGNGLCAHGFSVCEETPNDPKLSDRGARRDGCDGEAKKGATDV